MRSVNLLLALFITIGLIVLQFFKADDSINYFLVNRLFKFPSLFALNVRRFEFILQKSYCIRYLYVQFEGHCK